MARYKLVFSVNNVRTEMIVSANSEYNAKKIVEAQFSGSKIMWISCTKL